MVSPFPEDDHKATRHRQDNMTVKNIIKNIHTKITTLELSVRKLLEGFKNKFQGTNLTLSSDGDQDT